MKTIISMVALAGTICLSGCKEQSMGEPNEFGLYFTFVTQEGGDFFKSDTRYDVSKVTFSNYRIVYQLYTLDNKNVFETNYNSGESMIDFGNGDRDTLKVEWLPNDYGANDGNAKDLEKVIFTYNGVIVDTWEFDPDLKFFFEMVNRNGLIYKAKNNPIVINLSKSADEAELN